MGESVIKRRMNKSRGFSLLEIILVLALIGIILVMVATYARKLIDEKTRRVAADAVAQDVYGVLQFVNAETIKTYTSNNPGDVTGRATKDVTNPLYQLPGMAVYPESEDTTEAALKGLTSNPIWLAHPHSNTSLDATSADVSPYIARNYSTGITRPVSNDINMTDGGKTYYSHSLKWSQVIWGQDSVRSYFTDSGCQSGATGAGNTIYFSQQFLSCSENPALHNSEIGISRIDLVNDKGSFTRIATSDDHPAPVNRVDVYVSFRPVDENPARIGQFITPLMTAFRMQKIMPNTDNIFLVRSLSGTGNDNAWTLLNKNTGQPANKDTPVTDLARYSDLPDLVGKLQKGQTYALRFTFDGKGDYLRTDGVNAATKVCWNTKDGVAGPCLTSPAQDALVLKQRQNIREFANLQVGDVISKGVHLRADGATEDEYHTTPQIRYAAFSNTNQIEPYYRNPADGATDLCTVDGCGQTGPSTDTISDPANGAISVPLQTCPQSVVNGDGVHVDMYPRLSAVVSSVVSGMRKGTNDTIDPNNRGPYFNNQSDTMVKLSQSDVSINRLGGSILQIGQSADGTAWRIAAMVGAEDTSPAGHPWQYYNPPWMSVMITTWCSSVKQP